MLCFVFYSTCICIANGKHEADILHIYVQTLVCIKFQFSEYIQHELLFVFRMNLKEDENKQTQIPILFCLPLLITPMFSDKILIVYATDSVF